MLLLFKGVLHYVTQLSLKEVEEQLLVLPASMPPQQIRTLLAHTIWAEQDPALQREALFAKQFSYRAKLPCGGMLAAVMSKGAAQCSLSNEFPKISRADAAGLSFTAHWIFSIDTAAGSLRATVESEGFLLVKRASGKKPYLLDDDAAACPETMPVCAGGTEDEDRSRKRRRYSRQRLLYLSLRHFLIAAPPGPSNPGPFASGSRQSALRLLG